MKFLIGGIILILIIGVIDGGKDMTEIIAKGIFGIIALALIFILTGSCSELIICPF